MTEYTFGGSKSLKIYGSFIKKVSVTVKWFTIKAFKALKKYYKYLDRKSSKMLLNAEKNVIYIDKISFVDGNTKRFKFRCNGGRYRCYQHDNFGTLYVEFKDKEVEVTETDYMFVRYNPEWYKI